MRKRWLSVGLILAIILSALPGRVWALEPDMEQQFVESAELGVSEVSEEVFPENSVAAIEDLKAGNEEIFLEGSESDIYTEEDSNAGNEIEIPEDADSDIASLDEDLGASEELMDRSDSPIYEDESLDAGLEGRGKPTVDVEFSGDSEDDIGGFAGSVTIAKGSAKQLICKVSNCHVSYYLQCITTNSKVSVCRWGNWRNGRVPLTVTGKNPGSERIFIYLRSANTGDVLYGMYFQVTVTAKAKVTVSVSSLNLKVGQSTKVMVSYSNHSGLVYMQYGTNNGSVQSCSWGNWSGNRVPLKVTGNRAGSSTVFIYLRSVKSNQILATTFFTVNVTENPRVTASVSSVTINTDGYAVVDFTVSGMYGGQYLQYKVPSTYAYGCTWGKWHNNKLSLTIRGRNAGSGRVTVYLKNASGVTVASTSVLVTVRAAQIPKIKLSHSSLSLRSGNAAVVTATVSNVSTAFNFDYSTTNTDAYSCDWGEWIGDHINFIITGKKAGSGTINIYLRSYPDKTILASARLTVTVEESGIISDLSYSFPNFAKEASMRICQYMFQNRVAEAVYNWKLGAGGSCFGMASTSGMFYNPQNDILPNQFNYWKSAISQLEKSDKNSVWGLTVEEFIQAMQISQLSSRTRRIWVNGSELSRLVSNVNTEIVSFRPTMICVYGVINGQNTGHSILAYGMERVSSTKDRLLIYDNNYPQKTCYLELYKDSSGTYTGWSYPIEDGYIWGSGKPNGKIAYFTYSKYLELWQNRGDLTYGNENLLVANSNDLTICDVDDTVVATVTDGVLNTDNENIQEVVYDSLNISDDVQNENYILRLPVDLYTVKNEDSTKEQFIVEIVNEELSARVVSTSDEVTVCADDSCNLASVLMDTKKDEEYQITLGSSREGEPNELEFNDIGTGDMVSVMVEDGLLETCNVDEDGLTMGEMNDTSRNQVYTITCTAGENGNITPNGTDTVLSGGSQEYRIIPDSGYKIQDVIVDGVSVGAVNSYTFEQVQGNHTIQAFFEKIPQNVISVKNIVKTASKKAQSFQLKVGLKGKAKLSYYSDNKWVKVSDKGYVTIAKNFVGKANIVITVESSLDYQTAKKTITITVRPSGVSVSKIIKGSKKMTVRWKKNPAVTGYQIQYGLSSSFQSSKFVTVRGYQKESKSISGLKKNKVYYARIRTYKVVSGTKYYSTWSKTKKVKIR